MTTFANTSNPTPFGVFDSDTDFQSDADSMVTFVKRKLGDDILSVELTKKQIFACFEESFFEYGQIVNEYQARSTLANFLGTSTGSMSGSEQKYPRETLEFLNRQSEPYSFEAGVGGAFNSVSGSIQLVAGTQDYNIYENLKDKKIQSKLIDILLAERVEGIITSTAFSTNDNQEEELEGYKELVKKLPVFWNV